MHPLYDDNTFYRSNVGPNFEEPRFTGAAYARLEASPRKPAQRLRCEETSHNLRIQLGLRDETAPPENHSPYIEGELLEDYASRAGTAKASSPADSRKLHGSSLCGCNSEQTIELEARDISNDLTSPLSLLTRRRCRHSSVNDAHLPESARSSPLPVSSSRGSSLSEPAPFVGVRQPFSQGSAMERELVLDVPRLLRLGLIPLQAETRSQSLHWSESEIRSFTGRQSSLCGPHGMGKESVESDAKTERYSGESSSQSESVLAQPTHSIPSVRNRALPKTPMPARKRSSDGSYETERTMSSTGRLSITSGSAVNFSCFAD